MEELPSTIEGMPAHDTIIFPMQIDLIDGKYVLRKYSGISNPRKRHDKTFEREIDLLHAVNKHCDTIEGYHPSEAQDLDISDSARMSMGSSYFNILGDLIRRHNIVASVKSGLVGRTGI